MRDGEAAIEQPGHDLRPVDGRDQRLPHAPVGERRRIEVHVEMLVDQPRLVGEAEAVPRAAFQRGRLIQRQAELARHHVDLPGQQLRLQRGGVLHRADGDAAEGGGGAVPGRVAL